MSIESASPNDTVPWMHYDYTISVEDCNNADIITPAGSNYRKTSNISRTLVDNEIVDNSDVVGSALLQLHLPSQLNTWLQWMERRQLQDDTRNI